MKKINSFIDYELIKVITGIRGCGKSYFLNLIIEELIKRGISKENIVLIDFNQRQYKYVDNTLEFDLTVEDLVKDIDGKLYLFFDEIQNVGGWQKSILSFTTLYDCDIYLTASNSKILSGKLSNLLTGRYVQINMFPFSFNEFLEYKNNSQFVDELFDEYMLYGGMPLVTSLEIENKKDYLEDSYSSILLNDIVERHNIRDVGILKRIMELFSDNIGKPVSLANIMADDKINVSRKTVYNYIDYLLEACLIYNVVGQNLDGKEKLLNEKFYLCNHGFLQVLVGNNFKNISCIIENIVYIELLTRGYDITFGKVEGKEIDFVCRKTDRVIYVQVINHLDSDEVIEREFGSLLLVKDNYPKFVISMDKFDFSQKGIIHLNLLDFLTYKKGDI